MTDLIPPHNLEAERCVLGCCLLDKAARITVLSMIREDDFFQPPHRLIYNVIEAISNSGRIPDFVTVSNALMESGNLEAVGGGEYVAGLTNTVPSVRNAEFYGDIVREASGRRRMIRLGSELMAAAYGKNCPSCDELQNTVLSQLMEIGRNRANEKAQNLYTTYLESIQYAYDVTSGKRQGPLKMGYPDLDRKFALEPGDMAAIGGYTSTGKTTLAVNFARNVAYAGGKVLFLSLEMTRRQIDHKFAAAINNLPGHLFKYGKFYQDSEYGSDATRYTETLKKMGNRIWIKHCPGATLGALRRTVKQEMIEHPGICLVLIDYLQLIRLDTTRYVPATEKMTIVSGTVQVMAMECEVPIIAMSQFNRKDKSQVNRPPALESFRESGSIEQDSGYCLLLNLLEDQTDGKHWNLPVWEIELIIAKGRTEGTSTTVMQLTRNTGVFEEILEPTTRK